MAKVTITVQDTEDGDGGIQLTVNFEPAIPDEAEDMDDLTPAQVAAHIMLTELTNSGTVQPLPSGDS